MFSCSQENVKLGLEYPGDTLPKTERCSWGSDAKQVQIPKMGPHPRNEGEEGRAKATAERVYLSRHQEEDVSRKWRQAKQEDPGRELMETPKRGLTGEGQSPTPNLEGSSLGIM